MRNALLLVPLVVACGEPIVELPATPAECDALDPAHCLLPWPSDHFRDDDGVAIPESAMITSRSRIGVDPSPWNAWDGFSATTSAITELPVRIDPSPLPSWRDDAPGLDPASPTVVLDAETGERVAHFAEIEGAEDAAPDRTTLYVRPMARLAESRRYVVAVRGLTAADGRAVESSPAFAALRDGTPTDRPSLEARRARFDAEVFAPLETAGVARAELLVAWDFTTGGGRSAWGGLADAATEALALAGDDGLGCAVSATEARDGYTIVDGTFTVPRFVSSGAGFVADGTTEADFRAVVPDAVVASIRAGGDPAEVVVYGHGLFDHRGKVSEPGSDGRTPPLEVANRCGGQVWVATDFLGLAADMNPAAAGLVELSAFDAFFAEVAQGLLNTLLLGRTFAGRCAGLEGLAVDGAPVAAAPVHYYGNSQGAILGTTIAALSPDIERYALGVGGVGYPVMLPRSIHWAPLGAVLAGSYPDRLVRDLAMTMFAQRWDLVEGAAFAPHVLSDPLPGMRERPARVLYQVGLHDVQTANVASEYAARTMGLAQPADAAHPVWGLPTLAEPATSGYFVFDVGAEPAPTGTVPATGPNGVHEAVRRLDAAQEQVCALFAEGVVRAP